MSENKNELKIVALTQRIGEITVKYELQIIDIRAEATIEINRLMKENEMLKMQNDLLKQNSEDQDVAIPEEE
jgi:hypothetical protein